MKFHLFKVSFTSLFEITIHSRRYHLYDMSLVRNVICANFVRPNYYLYEVLFAKISTFMNFYSNRSAL